MTETRKSTDKDKELPRRDNIQKNPHITKIINGINESYPTHDKEHINFISKKWLNYVIVIAFVILFFIVLLQGIEIRKVKETLNKGQKTTIEKVMEKVVPDKKK